MGLGGYLTWTATAREIRKLTGKQTKILPIEQHGPFIKIVSSDIFDNNNDFVSKDELFHNYTLYPMVLNDPKANYCKKDTPGKAHHRLDKHIIEQISEAHGINSVNKKCYIDHWDKDLVENIIKNEIGADKFLTIEPISKTNYTKNRVYPFEKWQNIVNSLYKDIKVAQVGVSGSRLLDNVVDLTGKTNFINCAALIGESELFLSSEGGLVHAATAFDTKSVVVITGYQSETMVAYPQNININISKHGPCGLKTECYKCTQDAQEHDWTEIVEICREELCL
jgi:hypothetical protein